MNENWTKVISYILGFIALMGVAALIALLIVSPMPSPIPLPPPPQHVGTPTHANVVSMVAELALLSFGFVLFINGFDFRRPLNSFLHLVLWSCIPPAGLNAVFLWEAHDDWVVSAMWLFHNEPVIYWATSAAVIVGSIWILVLLFCLPMAFYRLCCRALRGIQQ